MQLGYFTMPLRPPVSEVWQCHSRLDEGLGTLYRSGHRHAQPHPLTPHQPVMLDIETRPIPVIPAKGSRS